MRRLITVCHIGAVVWQCAAVPLALPAQTRSSRPDTTCKPCEDFYEYANDRSTTARLTGALEQLGSAAADSRRQQARIDQIVSSAAAAVRKGIVSSSTDRYRIGAFFNACTDTAQIERIGVAPLRAWLRTIDTLTTATAVFHVIGELNRDFGVGFITAGVAVDASDARVNIPVMAFFSGLGLTSQGFYLDQTGRVPAVRDAYLQYVRGMFELLGAPADSAAAQAAGVLRLETEIARRQPSLQVAREPHALDFVIAPADLDTLIPHVPWRALWEGAGAPPVARLNARYPTALRRLDSLIANTSLEDWKTLLRWTVARAMAPTLSRALVIQDSLFAAVVSGSQASARQIRCAEETRAAFSDAIAQEYVRRYFSPAARHRAQLFVNTLVVVLRERIGSLPWMTDSTKRAALVKIDSLVRNIGYPDDWRSAPGFTVMPDDYFGNTLRLARSVKAARWKRLTATNDRSLWRVSASLPRAGYNPPFNQMTITAAFLQPPLFVPGGDVATNYGAAGVVIAHELTHVFDPIGGRFDASGNLRNWWVREDLDHYTSTIRPLIEQFSAYPIDSTAKVNGQATLAENVADLGGLQIAYLAMERSLGEKWRRRVGGFTPEQRFFLAWARLLKQNESGDPALDPANATHSPPRWRVNGPLSNLPEFGRAWECKERDAMMRPRNERVVVW